MQEITLLKSAQRLSASEIQHSLVLASSFQQISAQRLSASEIQHLRCDRLFDYSDRAQRLSASEIQHFHSFDKFQRAIAVLNAFRHQRFNTDGDFVSIDLAEGCSTPFGIRDSTRDIVCSYIRRLMCSTPFGIRDSTLKLMMR